MIQIDGSYGEGGGQILRSSLALSLITGKAFTMNQIRAGRSKPGLARQHVMSVTAAGQIGTAEMSGAVLGSRQVTFRPGPVRAGTYDFDIGSAGSTTLVLQTILLPLLLADGPSLLSFSGGTHNPHAPTYDFLAKAFIPLIERLGPEITMRLERHGFYPAGGGRMFVNLQPAAKLQGLSLPERGEIKRRRVRAIVAKLRVDIAERECDEIQRKSGWPADCFQVEKVDDSLSPGNVILIEINSDSVTELFAAMGARGVPAETVAKNAWREAEEYLAAEAPVGPHLADQLLLPLALAASRDGAASHFRTGSLTEHFRTNVHTVQTFLDVPIRVTELEDEQHDVYVG